MHTTTQTLMRHWSYGHSSQPSCLSLHWHVLQVNWECMIIFADSAYKSATQSLTSSSTRELDFRYMHSFSAFSRHCKTAAF